MLHRTSLVLFAVVSLFLIWFGVTYASVADMLPFHAAAVPDSVRDQMKPLYLALMTLVGASSAALGVLGRYIIAIPMRRETPAAAAILAVTNTIVFVMAAITAEKLAATTGSPTSWHLMGVGLAVTFVALVSHTAAAAMGKSAGNRPQ